MYKSVKPINVMESSSELHANINFKQDVCNAISKLHNFCQLAYKALDEVKALNEDLEIEYVSALSEVEHLEDCYHFKINRNCVSSSFLGKEWTDNIFQPPAIDENNHITVTEGTNTNAYEIKSEPVDNVPLHNDVRPEIIEHHGDNKDKALDKAEIEICMEPESKKQRLIKNEDELKYHKKEELMIIQTRNTNTKLGKLKVFQTPGPTFKKIICNPKQSNANAVSQSAGSFPIQTFSLSSPNQKKIILPTATKMQSVKIPLKVVMMPSLKNAAVTQQNQNKICNLQSPVAITNLGDILPQPTSTAVNTVASKDFGHELNTQLQAQDEEVNESKPVKPIDEKFLLIHDEQMGKIIQCKICTCRFSRMDIFKRHLGTFHREHPDIECDICFETFETGVLLKLHMDSHRTEYPFQCNTCGRRFELESKLKYHVTTPNKCILPSLKCKICNETFLTITEITRHFSNRHEGSNCDVCCLPSTDHCKEEKHFVEHLKPYKCQVCDEEFSFKKEFLRHQKTAHKRETKKRQKIVNGAKKVRRQCQFCTLTFKCDSDLHEHERVHTGEKPFTCTYCGRKFARKERLKVHERLHTGERPFQCDLCGKEMLEKRNIKRHSCIMRKSL